jgi:protein CpxP
MKKLIIATLLLVGISSFAQEGNKMERRQHGMELEKFTSEQQNELMLKKMILELDLSAKQQNQMKSIMAEKSAKHDAMIKARKENKEKPTREERFALKSTMLDEQIGMKGKMKSILSVEQFEKWETIKAKHDKQRGMHHRKGMHEPSKKEVMKK